MGHTRKRAVGRFTVGALAVRPSLLVPLPILFELLFKVGQEFLWAFFVDDNFHPPVPVIPLADAAGTHPFGPHLRHPYIEFELLFGLGFLHGFPGPALWIAPARDSTRLCVGPILSQNAAFVGIFLARLGLPPSVLTDEMRRLAPPVPPVPPLPAR